MSEPKVIKQSNRVARTSKGSVETITYGGYDIPSEKVNVRSNRTREETIAQVNRLEALMDKMSPEEYQRNYGRLYGKANATAMALRLTGRGPLTRNLYLINRRSAK